MIYAILSKYVSLNALFFKKPGNKRFHPGATKADRVINNWRRQCIIHRCQSKSTCECYYKAIKIHFGWVQKADVVNVNGKSFQ